MVANNLLKLVQVLIHLLVRFCVHSKGNSNYFGGFSHKMGKKKREVDKKLCSMCMRLEAIFSKKVSLC